MFPRCTLYTFRYKASHSCNGILLTMCADMGLGDVNHYIMDRANGAELNLGNSVQQYNALKKYVHKRNNS